MHPQRKIIEMACRRVREGSGSYAIRSGGEVHIPVPDLCRMLEGIPFVLVGGIATSQYMPERMTLDIDILLSAENEGRAYRALEKEECIQKGRLAIGGSTWELPDGSVLDVIVCSEPWMEEAMATKVMHKNGLPTISLPYLVLMKLSASRVQDLADISRMLGCADEQRLDEVRELISRYKPQDKEDLESLIDLGNLEHKP